MSTVTTDGIVWEEPPMRGFNRGGQLAVEIAEQLRAKPGVWARVAGPGPASSLDSLRHSLVYGRRGLEAPIKAGEFEAVKRTVDGASYLWARYVGKELDER